LEDIRMKKYAFFLIVFLFALIFSVQGTVFALDPVKPLGSDKCPVCGMKVTPYPNWIAQIIFSDGSYAVFDGPKDMLKYYFEMDKYNKSPLKTSPISTLPSIIRPLP